MENAPLNIRETHHKKYDLFAETSSDHAITTIDYEDYRPTAVLSEYAPIVFDIQPTGSDYINLKKSSLYIKAKITKANGDPVTEADETSFANMPLSSLFRAVDLELNHQNLTSGVSNCYPYKAMIDTLLQPTDHRSLVGELFLKDRAGHMQDETFIANTGLASRWIFTRHGKEVELTGPLSVDICQQDKLLLNGIAIVVRLFPQTKEFALMTASDEQYKFVITDAVLRLCHHRMNPALVAAHHDQLQNTPALYPFTTSELKVFSISQGSYNFSTDNLFSTNVPKRLYCALVLGAGFTGQYNKNPFFFQHVNVDFMGFYVSGQSRPGPPYQPNFKEDHDLIPFTALAKSHPEMQIERTEFGGGYTLFCLDLEEEQDRYTVSQANTRLVIKFAKPLPQPMNLVVYGRFPSIMEVDHMRNIKLAP